MAIFLPPAITINRFKGGFKSTPDFTDLTDTETNDSRNVVYNPNTDIEKRKGSIRLLNERLTATGVTAGAPIVGHYHFTKLGTTNRFHIVGAGDVIYNYTSATSVPIRTGMSANSQTYWATVQVQDPRSASDDVVVMSNGLDRMQAWNGSATAIQWSAVASATQVPIAKYLLTHQRRIYAANILDASDVDSPVKVFRTVFGADGAPRPQRFTESFFVGGSSRDGQLQGQKLLGDDIIYYTERAIWAFSPGLGDLNDLREVVEDTGLLAPHSLVGIGNFHIFLSERGVMTFDGNTVTSLSSQKIDDLLLDDTNLSQLALAKGVYDIEKNQYKLYIPKSGSSRNNLAVIFDFRLLIWQPPLEGREVSYISTFIDSNGKTKIIYGDYRGYLYEDERGNNEGVAAGINDTSSEATANTLTAGSATYLTDNNGYSGLTVKVISGAGEGQERFISTNTSAVLTLETNWDIIPNSSSRYAIGGINSFWQSKDYDLGGADISKLFKSVKLRTREQGNYELDMHYIIDFHKLGRATVKEITLLASGMIWGLALWGSGLWGREEVISLINKLRSTPNQSIIGNHIAFRFTNQFAEQPWRINGFDIEFKALGKR